MSYYQRTAQLSADELTKIVGSTFRSLDEGKAKALGQGIARAGAELKHAIIERNQPADVEIARRMRCAAQGLAATIEAFGLLSGPNTSAASPGAMTALSDAFTQSIRPILFGLLAGQQTGADQATGRAQADETLDRWVQSVVPLHALLDEGTRRLESVIARPKRQSQQRDGLSRATFGRFGRGAKTRVDNELEHFLHDIWKIYLLALPRGVPKTSVGAVGRTNRGKASGPFIRFCRACIDWVLTQLPSELFAGDTKLGRMRHLTDGAIRLRVQRAVDFGNMRATNRSQNAHINQS